MKQKTIVDTQKIMRKESKHNTKENHQTIKPNYQSLDKEIKRRRKEERNYKTARNQQNAISTNLSKSTLNVNGLNSPVKRHGVAEWIKNQTHLYTAYKKLQI